MRQFPEGAPITSSRLEVDAIKLAHHQAQLRGRQQESAAAPAPQAVSIVVYPRKEQHAPLRKG